jgi:hypothetical protein
MCDRQFVPGERWRRLEYTIHRRSPGEVAIPFSPANRKPERLRFYNEAVVEPLRRMPVESMGPKLTAVRGDEI